MEAGCKVQHVHGLLGALRTATGGPARQCHNCIKDGVLAPASSERGLANSSSQLPSLRLVALRARREQCGTITELRMLCPDHKLQRMGPLQSQLAGLDSVASQAYDAHV